MVGLQKKRLKQTLSSGVAMNYLEPTFSFYFIEVILMYIGVVLRIQEHQSRRNNTSMPKMLLVHLKKEEQGRGTLKNSSTSPENISEVVFFYI